MRRTFPHGLYLWDTPWHWKVFFRSKIGYWERFIDKWVLPTLEESNAIDNEGDRRLLPKTEQVLLLNYDDFMAAPKRTLREISAFINPQEQLPRERIGRVVNKLEIQKQRDFHDFRFFDYDWLLSVEERLKTTLGDARLQPLAHESVMNLGQR